jgi:hypothetical protein
MFTMLKFLVRLTLLLKFKTPPNVFSLISRGFYLLGDSWNEEVPSPDLEYLRLLRSIAEILILEGHPHIAAHKLQALDHGGSMRSNAAIAFALGSLSPSRIVSSSGEFLKWSPISPTAPSTMEILAQAQLLGAISLTKLPGISWEILSLETKVEVAFCEAKKKAFANASEILNQHVNEIEEKYGAKSLELLLIGTVLINCWNAAGQEANGERFGRHIWTNIFGTFNVDTTVEATHQVYLMVAMADSFLGQGKYNEARRMLVGVLEYPVTDSNLTMSTTLRLLKISRRLKQQATLFDDWTRLKKAVKNFDALSDTLKYECIEETVCLLSTLEPKDIPQIPQASDVVKILSRYCIDTYQGSNSSGVNLLQNMEEIQRFKSKLNLFSLSGPQLFYCRKMRERFSSATVPLVEKVGSANWQRFKRIKEMRETIEEVQVEARIPPAPLPAKSVFQDSGLGSSIGSDPMLVEPSPEQIPEVARSITSIRSFMSHQEGATSLPPIPAETPKGERTCFICEKSIKDIKNESQWRSVSPKNIRILSNNCKDVMLSQIFGLMSALLRNVMQTT